MSSTDRPGTPLDMSALWSAMADDVLPKRAPALVLRGRALGQDRAAVMAIINRTNDSFYAPARFTDDRAALEAVARAIDEGADLIDVGGVRAGVGPEVTPEEEIMRVVPFIAEVRRRYPEVLVSVDTWRAEVALAAGEAGADLINDTWAGFDPDVVTVAATLGVAVVCSHTGGRPPRTDPDRVTFPLPSEAPAGTDPADGVLIDVMQTLWAGAQRAEAAGIDRASILIDPTHDFGKRTVDSLRLVQRTAVLCQWGYPVLMALSRKDFVGETLDRAVETRLAGTEAATAIAAWHGATLFRTHDVAATRDVVDMVAAIRGDLAPRRPIRGL